MRREGALQDESMVQSTLAGKTTSQQMFDYYLGWIGNPKITDHYQPLKPADYQFVDDWGMAVAMNDLHAVIEKARDGGKRTVTLGGHSLGGTEAAVYPAWDFNGQAGYTTINGIVCIDGCAGAQSTFAPPATIPSVQASIAQMATTGPWLDLLKLGLPWATGVFSQVGAVTAYKDPTGPATTFANFRVAARLPEGARTGDQRGPVRLRLRLQDVATQPGADPGPLGPRGHYRRPGGLGGHRHHPGRRTSSTSSPRRPWPPPSGTTRSGCRSTPAPQPHCSRPRWRAYLGLRLMHTAQVDVPLYAFQTALGGKNNGVVGSADAYKAESKIPTVTAVSRTATYSHLDPLLAAPSQNDFLKTVVPWLKQIDK